MNKKYCEKILEENILLQNKIKFLLDECEGALRLIAPKFNKNLTEEDIYEYRITLNKIADFEAKHIYCSNCFHKDWNRENIRYNRGIGYPCNSCEDGNQFLESKKLTK